MKKIKKRFIHFIDLFRYNLSHGNYLDAFCDIVLMLMVLAAIGLLAWLATIAAGHVLDFFVSKFDIIATLVVGGGIAVWWLKRRREDRQDVLTEQRNRERLENELAHQAMGESTYLTARQAMYEILTSIAPSCNLQAPEGLSSIEAPRHFISRDDMLIFQFVAVKRTEVNIRTMTALIEGRIQQMANAHELNFEPSTLVILGQVYSAIMVDSIHDYGSYVQIDIVFTTERYIRYRSERDHQNHQPPFTGGGSDHDFL
jgi:hypothetical protein